MKSMDCFKEYYNYYEIYIFNNCLNLSLYEQFIIYVYAKFQ